MSDTQPEKLRVRSYLAAGAMLFTSMIVLALNARQYWPYIADDALISLRYVDRFLNGHGLTWTDGISVEGYSNLLWILLISPFGLLGIDLLVAVRILGFCGMIAVVGAILYRYRVYTWSDLWPPLIGVAFFTLAGPIGVWTIGGLEQPLVAGLLAWSMVLLLKAVESGHTASRYTWTASLCLGLLCITRPDGPLFAAAVVLYVFIVKGLRRDGLRLAWRVAVLPIVFTTGQQLFRLTYYGEWLPNPALVKISPSWVHLASGWEYVLLGLHSLTPFSYIVLLVAAPLIFFRRKGFANSRNAMILLIVPITIWLAYIAFIGGDVFHGWRHFVVIIVLLALTISEITRLLTKQSLGRSAQVVLLVGVSLCLVWFHQNQLEDPGNHKATEERWEYSGQVIGTMLKRGFGEVRPVVAVTAAGCIPYWSGLPCVDMLGLNDHYLARNHPKEFGLGWIGHELRDDQYVIDLGVDIIIIHVGGDWMYKMRQFYDKYILCHFEGHEPFTHQTAIWIKRTSDKIGIRTDDTAIVIPAYLLNGNHKTMAYLTEDNRFVIPVTTEQPAWLTWMDIPAGQWQAEVISSAEVAVTIEALDTSEASPVKVDGDQIDAPVGGTIRITVFRFGAEAAEVEKIILRRVAP